MDNFTIEKFTLSDLMSIKDILEKEFDDFWNFSILEKELTNDSSIYLCCKIDSEIVGFAGISVVLDTAELNNIVIKKEQRGNGYSFLLLKELISIAESRGCTKFNLEVATNNEVAINLYKKLGFKQVGMRSKYYNGIDALLFTLELITLQSKSL